MIGLIRSSEDAFDDATANDDEEDDGGVVLVESGEQAANITVMADTETRA